MKRWKYAYDEVKAHTGIFKHNEILTRRGEEGWEMVSAVPFTVDSDTKIRFYWKQEISEAYTSSYQR